MSTTAKNKGGQKPWTTEEQKAWLTALIPDYLASRGSSAPGDFWPGLFEDWFQTWPLGEANAMEKEAGVTDQFRLKERKKVSKSSSENRAKLTKYCSKSKIGSRITLERAPEAWREGDATC